jgi:hypothetical protein
VLASELSPLARLLMLVLLARVDTKTATIPVEHTPSLTVLAAETGLDRSTRHVCRECGKDLRLRPFVRLRDGSIVCRRCYRDRWAPR